MAIAFRPATAVDFDYCAKLYFAAMGQALDELKLDRAAHALSFRDRWDFKEVRIIRRDGSDIGWLQSRIEVHALFLAQLFVDGPYRGHGIGTEIMHYERLGFRTTHEDARKFYMRREPGNALE